MEIKEEDYQKAVAVVRKSLSGSVSNIQRKLNWGYCRAASAVDRMQNEFIVSPMSVSGRREVYPEEMHELWKELQVAKSQATPEGFVLMPKLSANYLFNKVPELGFKHQDEKDTVLYHLNYMASEFKESAKEFVKKDHEKQIKFLEEEAREQSHDS